MAKKQTKQNPMQELNARLQKLMSQRLKAHGSGASGQIMEQLDRMIAETQLDLHTETELHHHRNRKDSEDDGEQWIV
jgi:hypothetical protein